jgi:hypothetical protein
MTLNLESSETVKYGHESHGTWNQEWLCWPQFTRPHLILNLQCGGTGSSEMMQLWNYLEPEEGEIAIADLQLPKNLTPNMGCQINSSCNQVFSLFTFCLQTISQLHYLNFLLSSSMSSNLLHTNLFTYIKKLMAPDFQHGGAEGNELMQLWSHLDPEDFKGLHGKQKNSA